MLPWWQPLNRDIQVAHVHVHVAYRVSGEVFYLKGIPALLESAIQSAKLRFYLHLILYLQPNEGTKVQNPRGASVMYMYNVYS